MVLGFPAFLLLAALQPAEFGPPVPPARVTPERDCRSSDDPDEIVVCGESSENSPYRIPQEFRNQRSDEDRHASWTARVQDEESVARFDDQVTGGGGYLRNSLQRDCQWRAARQEAQGRRPDCTRRVRPDEATDWQRR